MRKARIRGRGEREKSLLRQRSRLPINRIKSGELLINSISIAYIGSALVLDATGRAFCLNGPATDFNATQSLVSPAWQPSPSDDVINQYEKKREVNPREMGIQATPSTGPITTNAKINHTAPPINGVGLAFSSPSRLIPPRWKEINQHVKCHCGKR
ncbi:hypothetical protein CEXT_393081 [Caerostris extrusa]|uniref:Uncharacterized protein n=1 Tax=Caerostris extrusa TaxID=172846 RepID=A0AAV4VXY7_CAEEX|nr:hypothetical protein CEXT_393081 [Caerostris extrusa]